MTDLDIDIPERVTAQTIAAALPAVDALRALPPDGALPAGLTAASLDALLAVMDAVIRAAEEDKIDLTPSEAAQRLRMARPSVMRLIARGDLQARREGGHYVLTPREVRLFQGRLAAARREAFATLATMARESIGSPVPPNRPPG